MGEVEFIPNGVQPLACFIGNADKIFHSHPFPLFALLPFKKLAISITTQYGCYILYYPGHLLFRLARTRSPFTNIIVFPAQNFNLPITAIRRR